MHVRYFAWFDSKAEKNEFLSLINSSRSDIEAIRKVMDKYPELKMAEAAGLVDNFKNELNKS